LCTGRVFSPDSERLEAKSSKNQAISLVISGNPVGSITGTGKRFYAIAIKHDLIVISDENL
jgi:aspartate/methionine/tyrosine aminotransferase